MDSVRKNIKTELSQLEKLTTTILIVSWIQLSPSSADATKILKASYSNYGERFNIDCGAKAIHVEDVQYHNGMKCTCASNKTANDREYCFKIAIDGLYRIAKDHCQNKQRCNVFSNTSTAENCVDTRTSCEKAAACLVVAITYICNGFDLNHPMERNRRLDIGLICVGIIIFLLMSILCSTFSIRRIQRKRIVVADTTINTPVHDRDNGDGIEDNHLYHAIYEENDENVGQEERNVTWTTADKPESQTRETECIYDKPIAVNVKRTGATAASVTKCYPYATSLPNSSAERPSKLEYAYACLVHSNHNRLAKSPEGVQSSQKAMTVDGDITLVENENYG